MESLASSTWQAEQREDHKFEIKQEAMGCAGSKQQAKARDDVAAADVYRPPPTSVSLFDISAVEEPWLIAKSKDQEEAETDDDDEEEEEEEEEDEKTKGAMVPLPLLEKLEGYELAPASWSEVSKALEDMKPALIQQEDSKKKLMNKKKKKKKKTTTKKKQQQEKAAADAGPTTQQQQESKEEEKAPPPELAGRRVVKDNPFLMRDRRESSNNNSNPSPRWKRKDPFEGCPERRPPGASGGGVVLYTTTLRGVRRTFEDCERAREVVESCAEAAGVPAVDERDVSLHGEYLRELRDLLPAGEEGCAPPRLFVMGRYVGGAQECVALAESGKLREMMRWAKARGEAQSFSATKDGRGCVGCGGARFVPCWECGGSCKVVLAADGSGNVVERCAKCNENGLMMCPICH